MATIVNPNQPPGSIPPWTPPIFAPGGPAAPTAPNLPVPKIKLPSVPYNPVGRPSPASIAGLMEWILVITGIILITIAYQAGGKLGGGLLFVVVLGMLYTARENGIF